MADEPSKGKNTSTVLSVLKKVAEVSMSPRFCAFIWMQLALVAAIASSYTEMKAAPVTAFREEINYWISKGLRTYVEDGSIENEITAVSRNGNVDDVFDAHALRTALKDIQTIRSRQHDEATDQYLSQREAQITARLALVEKDDYILEMALVGPDNTTQETARKSQAKQELEARRMRAILMDDTSERAKSSEPITSDARWIWQAAMLMSFAYFAIDILSLRKRKPDAQSNKDNVNLPSAKNDPSKDKTATESSAAAPQTNEQASQEKT